MHFDIEGKENIKEDTKINKQLYNCIIKTKFYFSFVKNKHISTKSKNQIQSGCVRK